MAFYMRRLGHPAASLILVVTRAHDLAPELVTYRVLLASLLAHTGEPQEAYELLRDVPLESVRCTGYLRRMIAVFHLAGEDAHSHDRREPAERVGDGGDVRPDGLKLLTLNSLKKGQAPMRLFGFTDLASETLLVNGSLRRRNG